MAMRNDSDEYGFIFQWKMKNLSCCCLKKGEELRSPTFIAYGLKDTKWSLLLYPRGKDEDEYVALYLRREKDCYGPKTIEINYELAFLDKNKSHLSTRTILVRDFKRGSEYGFQKFEIRKKVFDTERVAFLPKNTLTVRCTIWITDEKPTKASYSFFTTAITKRRRRFVWKTEKFSTLNPDLRNKFKEDLIDFDIFLSKSSQFKIQLCLDIISFDESIKYFSFKASDVVNSNVVINECFAGDLKKGISPIMTIDIRKVYEYPSLDCEYIFSTGIAVGVNEDFDLGIISPKVTTKIVRIKNEICLENVKCQNTSDLVEDLSSMYCDAVLCDTELRTSKSNFLAHKTILSARSSVFRKIFSNDMKENSGHVDITDLEDDTWRQMLVYMYTVSLGDLQFETAYKLYAAANKYQIASLKNRCCSFLKENLSLTNVCYVSILADLHEDNDLKFFVQNYILEHDQEVFGSEEWKDFMKINIVLAAEIMYRKVFPG